MSATPNNLGWVKSVYKGTSAPSNTDMIWFDDNIGVKKHKYYDVLTSTWTLLSKNSTTINDITSSLITNFGNVAPGDTIPAGSSLDDFITQCIVQVHYPTYTPPTLTLAATGVASSVEAGTVGNVTLTATFNRGSINGKKVGGIWQPSTFQNYRAGAANKYTIDSTDEGLTNTKILTSQSIALGVNTWSNQVDYDQGSQPVDSNDANYQSPLAAGSLTASTSISGYRKAIYGTDSVNSSTYTTSAQVRLLPSSLLNPANDSTFTISIPSGAKMVVFAYPATLQDVSSVKYVEFSNTEVKGIFTKTLINVEGANGYSATSYKVYTYIPVSPYSSAVTYNVTI